ncbi:agamous-like MADS-box protein AGL80 [Lycium ferocissimum]|uniref:agamous-like MADS-box protein AGL80 n=1 Tax=Lycium ferocissimum TaxID=112874 RepID=UPI0028151D0D|nr:agamous-like MADS-box protein AGL80 [Lycium ferocissimum]
MTRKKVKLAFIENNTDRKTSYKKRQKGFLKKAEELSNLCDVETAIVVYSPYHNEPIVFPSHVAVINTFTKLRELPELEQLKHMETLEEFTKKRTTKLEEQLRKGSLSSPQAQAVKLPTKIEHIFTHQVLAVGTQPEISTWRSATGVAVLVTFEAILVRINKKLPIPSLWRSQYSVSGEYIRLHSGTSNYIFGTSSVLNTKAHPCSRELCIRWVEY